MSQLARQHPGHPQSGYTLLEVVVVLAVLAVAAVVAPSLLSTRPEPTSELRVLVANARQASVGRGETVHLRVERSGLWQILVGSPPRARLHGSGRLSQPVGSRVELVFSPLGSCAPPAGSEPSQALPAYDPLTCEERPS